MVNIHMPAIASPGQSNGRNHSSDEAKCQRLPPSIQGTLKGESVRLCRRIHAVSDWCQNFRIPFSIPLFAGEKDLVVLGDFGCSPQSSELDVLRKEKLCALVPSTQFTNISTCSPQGTRCLDNIWVSRSLQKIYSGAYTVVFGQLHRLK